MPNILYIKVALSNTPEIHHFSPIAGKTLFLVNVKESENISIWVENGMWFGEQCNVDVSEHVAPLPFRSLTASSRCNLPHGSIMEIIGLAHDNRRKIANAANTETGIHTIGMMFEFEVVSSVECRTCAKENIEIPPLDVNI